MIYQTKPRQVEAVYWDGGNFEKVFALVDGKANCEFYNRCLFVNGFTVNVGEYVVVEDGAVYRLPADVFEERFELIKEK